MRSKFVFVNYLPCLISKLKLSQFTAVSKINAYIPFSFAYFCICLTIKIKNYLRQIDIKINLTLMYFLNLKCVVLKHIYYTNNCDCCLCQDLPTMF